jgi:hypothetical protein
LGTAHLSYVTGNHRNRRGLVFALSIGAWRNEPDSETEDWLLNIELFPRTPKTSLHDDALCGR